MILRKEGKFDVLVYRLKGYHGYGTRLLDGIHKKNKLFIYEGWDISVYKERWAR